MLNLRTEIVEQGPSAERELKSLGLSVDLIRKIARQSRSAKMEALPIDPCNAPGTQAYIYGVRGLRRYLLRKGWRMARTGNVEATIHDKLGIQLLFQNVDLACDPNSDPQSVSGKGSGSRRLVESGNQGNLFEVNQPRRLGKIGVTPKVWLMCVSSDERTLRAEVSAPLNFDSDQFEGFSKRIFVINESYEPTIDKKRDDDSGPDYEVIVNKK